MVANANNPTEACTASQEDINSLAVRYQAGVENQLLPYKDHLSSSSVCEVLLIKGTPGSAELSGAAPFSGADGKALSAALESLGWGTDNWVGIITKLPVPALSPEPNAQISSRELTPYQLRLIIEVIDPQLIIALDEKAHHDVMAAMAVNSEINDFVAADHTSGDATQGQRSYPQKATPALWRAGEKTLLSGRLLLIVSDFENSLSDDRSKQQVWAQLKQVARQTKQARQARR